MVTDLDASNAVVADAIFDGSRAEAGEVTDRALRQALAPGGRLVETLRVLRTRVEDLGRERPFRRIGVVSAQPGEGTTLTALGLAAALARGGARRVVLIEAGLRAPALEAVLHLSAAPGLSDWLAAGGDGPVCVRRVEPWGFSLVSGGKPRAEPAPLLESAHLRRLLEAAERAFEFVVVDCPPLLPAADSVLIQDLLDGFLLVVRARRAPREDLLRGISPVKPERLRGVVFNDLREILARSHSLDPKA
jgi:Mrp family chromosome partitioning ATPase